MFLLDKHEPEYERTQATYYSSTLYKEPLTPEYINSGKRGQVILKRGQAPWHSSVWAPTDMWNMQKNNVIHRYNDAFQYKLFAGWAKGGISHVTIWSQPTPHDSHHRHYEDNIIGQTVGGACVGLQIGCAFGYVNTFNVAYESGIYQTIAMPPSRWLPLHKATWSFKSRIFFTCVLQASSFCASYCFVDAVSSTLRHKDDIWNSVNGGLASGLCLYSWFKNPVWSLLLGLAFGGIAGSARFGMIPEGSPKLCFDFDRPLWGVFGGVSMWALNREPTPDRAWYHWDPKYRTF